MKDAEVTSKVREVSALVLLICFWGWVCRAYGYMSVPLWLILTPVALVALFWLTVLVLAFIAYVLCIIAKVDKEIEEERRQQNNEDLW